MEINDKTIEIYNAALKVFSQYGFKKSTVSDIAEELGFTKGALYQYVISKQDLYDKAVRYGLIRWQNKVKKAISDQTDVELQFETMCKKAFQYLSEDRVLKEILIKDPDIFPLSFKNDPYKEINNQSVELLKRILDKGIEQKKFRTMDTNLMANVLFSIYKMLIIETYVLGEQDANKIMDETVCLVTRGFYNT